MLMTLTIMNVFGPRIRGELHNWLEASCLIGNIEYELGWQQVGYE